MQREFIFTDKWSDLVFENRNQSYGAYMLRKRLPRNILFGYMLSVIFMGTVLFTGYQFSKVSLEELGKIINEPGPGFIFEIKPPAPIVPRKTNSEPKNNVPKSSTQNFVPVVADSSAISDAKEKILNSENIIESKDTSRTDNNLNNENTNGTKEKDLNEPVAPFNIAGVQKVPEFFGGDLALSKFIRSHVRYPEKYLSDGIGAIVYVSFVVDSSGKVTDAKAKNEIEGFPEFTNEALHAVSKMPRWIPGQQNGMNVPVIMTLPIRFTVKKEF